GKPPRVRPQARIKRVMKLTVILFVFMAFLLFRYLSCTLGCEFPLPSWERARVRGRRTFVAWMQRSKIQEPFLEPPAFQLKGASPRFRSDSSGLLGYPNATACPWSH